MRDDWEIAEFAAKAHHEAREASSKAGRAFDELQDVKHEVMILRFLVILLMAIVMISVWTGLAY